MLKVKWPVLSLTPPAYSDLSVFSPGGLGVSISYLELMLTLHITKLSQRHFFNISVYI